MLSNVPRDNVSKSIFSILVIGLLIRLAFGPLAHGSQFADLPANPDVTIRGTEFFKDGRPFRLKSINWEGFNTGRNILQGIEKKSLIEIIRDLKSKGFNSVRIPFSNAMLRIADQNYYNDSFYDEVVRLNPELNLRNHQTNPFMAFEKSVEVIVDQGLQVIVDNHNIVEDYWAQSSGIKDHIWFSDSHPEYLWWHDWYRVVSKLRDIPGVIGYELRNEVGPTVVGNTWQFPTWGDYGKNPQGNVDDNRRYYKNIHYQGAPKVYKDWRLASLLAIAAIRELDEKRAIFLGGLNWQMDLSFLSEDQEYFQMIRFMNHPSTRHDALYWFWQHRRSYESPSSFSPPVDPLLNIRNRLRSMRKSRNWQLRLAAADIDNNAIDLKLAYSVHIYPWVAPKSARPYSDWGPFSWIDAYNDIPLRFFPTSYAPRAMSSSQNYFCLNDCVSRIGSWANSRYPDGVNLISQDRIYDHLFGYLFYHQNQPYSAPVWISEFGIEDLKELRGYDFEDANLYENTFRYLVDYMTGRDLNWAYYTLTSFYPKSKNLPSPVAGLDIHDYCRNYDRAHWGYQKVCQNYGFYNSDWSAFMSPHPRSDQTFVDPRIAPMTRLLAD